MYQLRELQREDVKIINEWRNNPKLIEYLGAPFRFINCEIDIAWFENYIKNRDNSIRCAIIKKETESIIGLVSLTNIDYINRTSVLHIMLGSEEACGKGAGTYAVKTMVEHAFNNVNLRRIELKVLENNIRALRLYQKVGFQKEGLLRKAIYKNGEYKNLILMGLLKEEYENN